MRLLLVILLVLGALAPTSALASDWYRCRIDGQVRQACCCPQQEENDERGRGDPPGIERSCCCDVDRVDGRTSDLRARTEATAASAGAMITLEAGSEMPATPAAVAVLATSTPAQPRGPPSLFLRNCSLLI